MSRPESTFVEMSFNIGRRVLLCACCLVISGCALFDSGLPSLPSMLEKDPEYQTPHQVIPVWTDTVLHQSGARGQRGCGGRFMFYAGEAKESIRVDGSLIVYAWDDTKGNHQRKPDRKFAFEADKLQKHYSKSKVGHSYSFFLPWDDAGGDRRELTVVARFVGRDGADVTSAPSKVILPGPVAMPERPQTVEQSDDDDSAGAIQQVSYQNKTTVETRQRRSLTSSVIPLTSGFVERNQPATGYNANDLFGGDRESAADTRETDVADPQADKAADEDKPLTISEGPSAQRAARLLQSRFRARREQVAQRYASHAQNQQSPEQLPPETAETP